MTHPDNFNDPNWPGEIGSIPDEPEEPTDALPEPDQLPPMRDRGPGPDAAKCAECGCSIHHPLCKSCQCGELRKQIQNAFTGTGEP